MNIANSPTHGMRSPATINVIPLLLCLLVTSSLGVIPVIIETDIGTEMDDT